MTFVLSTRSSRLALWQAETTQSLLREAHPGLTVDLLPVRSSGDVDQATALSRFGRIGIFTVEVDRAVLDGRAAAGVHSLKDMTTELQEGLVLAAVLPRGPVEDVLVTRDGSGLDELREGARVATGSLRRKAMLLAKRSDLEVHDVRGNVETRLAKLDAGETDGLIMARAGLERLGLAERIAQVLETDPFLPAAGQGIVGITARAGDEATLERLAGLDHQGALPCALAERAFLRRLQGGCSAPVGAHATRAGGRLHLRARVLSVDGREEVCGSRSGPEADAEALGVSLAEELLGLGAAALVEGARG